MLAEKRPGPIQTGCKGGGIDQVCLGTSQTLFRVSFDIHTCLSIPPKYSVANTIGFLKGRGAVRIHRELLRERRMTGLHFWATAYCVGAVGLDEDRVRQYIREPETPETGQGDLELK